MKLLNLKINLDGKPDAYAINLVQQLQRNGIPIVEANVVLNLLGDVQQSVSETSATTASTASTPASTPNVPTTPVADANPVTTTTTTTTTTATTTPQDNLESFLVQKFGTEEKALGSGKTTVEGKTVAEYKPSELYAVSEEGKATLQRTYSIVIDSLKDDSDKVKPFHPLMTERAYWIEKTLIANGVLKAHSDVFLAHAKK